MTRMANDRGSILVMGATLVAVCLLAVVVLVDATAAFLQRAHVMAVADAAALAGAQTIDLPAYYERGASAITGLDTAMVPARVQAHVRGSLAAAEVPGLRIASVRSDGHRVEVVLDAPLRLPFLAALVPGARVVARASARLALWSAGGARG